MTSLMRSRSHRPASTAEGPHAASHRATRVSRWSATISRTRDISTRVYPLVAAGPTSGSSQILASPPPPPFTWTCRRSAQSPMKMKKWYGPVREPGVARVVRVLGAACPCQELPPAARREVIRRMPPDEDRSCAMRSIPSPWSGTRRCDGLNLSASSRVHRSRTGSSGRRGRTGRSRRPAGPLFGSASMIDRSFRAASSARSLCKMSVSAMQTLERCSRPRRTA